MKAVLLALRDYENHMTDEGWQLQLGLAECGVELWGKGFPGRDSTDVDRILRESQPDLAIVIDKREWHPTKESAFDKNAWFCGIGTLAQKNICRITICKDAATRPMEQRDWWRELNADAAICYYHPESVLRYATWIEPHQLIRTYHSVDSKRIRRLSSDRGDCLVSGMRKASVYPLRETCIANRRDLGISYMPHPGYHNCGTCTPHFLDALVGWKVHVCCASQYGFALRKIIESVACGCTVITDLPAYDVLPEIDEALIRVPTIISADELKPIIRNAVRTWDLDKAIHYAAKAQYFYDWRAVGRRLYLKIVDFYQKWKMARSPSMVTT